ncbi:DUF3168 domain-containing protein [Haliea salexigens]|uniref:DUF3168 domain-containing protein n=1 Tax=Haliea salexigens TaxID=287487 RepID=UPI000487995F
MSEPTLAFQSAVFSALDAALSCPVYDHVPQDSAYPYVTLAYQSVTSTDFLSSRKDSRMLYLSVWSTYRGQKEVLEIMQAVYNALHEQRIPLSTGRVAQLRVVDRDTNREPDGVTYMGRIRLMALTEH